ncbi:hypothetical protein [Jiella marina]|uniref:hypothetical protein n=1 Tax=Jiella sp. LLJ827 TaxID=2917712 RepID=UPI0021010948|nr:hypothetical protein [Jiella sp. LLJ827]MCQ0990554.1 hypothetical protein [Jiella sp. LLJ827]
MVNLLNFRNRIYSVLPVALYDASRDDLRFPTDGLEDNHLRKDLPFPYQIQAERKSQLQMASGPRDLAELWVRKVVDTPLPQRC